ncbi:HlyD family efflux transporter periplasmic adaptor subunit [Parasphingorhabdus halotolerans]|uniref:HlyD family efflux transporter periplasmic adaptor subunit n=1 Tax=Parasphingorhabdus halotolerans TaxID=2725558 RepID=A0A6H2DSD5_9SPHN|nr:HlyD family efflux transporter periplasmic adaptor subunit [Parasphingorhabdus halotolerans]
MIGGLVLLAAIIIAALLIFSRTEPEEKAPEALVPLVQAIPIEIRSGNLMIRGAGTVRASEELTLSSEVAGKLVYVNPNLREGQRIARGATLFRIDPSNYNNAVQTAQADVASQNVAVMEAREEVALAKAELARFQQRINGSSGKYANVDDSDYAARILPPDELIKNQTASNIPQQQTSTNRLATRQPQLLSARATLRRAQAQLADAQKALQRTVVRAPFSGVVRSEEVALGSYVAPGQSLGSIVGTGTFEAVIPLSEREAALIPSLWQPGLNRIEASIYSVYGGTRYRWQAFVDRASSVLNPQTRTIDVFLRIPNPTRGGAPAANQPDREVSGGASGAPPLFVGSFVDAEITGKALGQYATLPLAALRPGNKIWLVREGRLRSVTVEILQRTDTEALITTNNLDEKPVVVVSSLKSATDGQRVRIAKPRTEKTAASKPNDKATTKKISGQAQ